MAVKSENYHVKAKIQWLMLAATRVKPLSILRQYKVIPTNHMKGTLLLKKLKYKNFTVQIKKGLPILVSLLCVSYRPVLLVRNISLFIAFTRQRIPHIRICLNVLHLVVVHDSKVSTSKRFCYS